MNFLRFIKRFGATCAIFATMSLPAAAGTTTLFAAASLKTALDEIIETFEGETGHEVVLSVAGSSALARQIEQGAPADLFFSANVDWMERLVEGGYVDGASRRDLLGNGLVLVGAPGQELAALQHLPTELADRRLAMALVDAVPAGIYGKAALESYGLWESLAPNVAQAANVRAALALVATGEAPFGIVYATDATIEPRVRVLVTFPEVSHPAIVYPIGRVAGRGGEATDALYDFLGSQVATDIFVNAGFTHLEDGS